MRRLTAVLAMIAGLLISVNTVSADAPRLALVIANSKYTGGMDPLVNPANDGALVRQTLERLGFQVTLLNDADQRSMKRAIADFGSALEEAGPETTALFYYAGHGLQVNGFNYLIPVNADIRKEADVDIEGVAAENILRQMEFAMPKT
ncbi:caspase domain-containing protein, partial [Dongia mobilis]